MITNDKIKVLLVGGGLICMLNQVTYEEGEKIILKYNGKRYSVESVTYCGQEDVSMFYSVNEII